MKTLFFTILFVSGLNCYGNNNNFFSTNNSKHGFVENKGQIRDQHDYKRKDIDFEFKANNGLSVFVGSASIHYQFCKANENQKSNSIVDPNQSLSKPEPLMYTMYRLDVVLIGANKNAEILKSEPQEYYEQYYLEWSGEKGVKAHSFSKITYKEIYPHIDWVLYTKDGKLKHEFIVRKGGNPKDIQIKYDGASELGLDQYGILVAKTPLGTIKENAPVSFTANGKSVGSKFQLNNNLLSYQIEPYTGTLIIDPSLEWGTYYGDTGYDLGFAVANDQSNNVYICGTTFSSNGIATSGAHESIKMYYLNTFLAKFNSSGVRLWATYYGGQSGDPGPNIITDSFNNVYMCGRTTGYGGMTTTGSYQPIIAGSEDAFLVKFDSSGKRIWATYYGGENTDIAMSVIVDRRNYIYLCGYTTSTTGIASPGAFQPSIGGSSDGFIVKFSNTGSRIWASYFGGNRTDRLVSIHSDQSDNIYLSGNSTSDTGISTLGAHQIDKSGTASSTDAILVKFDSSGKRLWATYYGGQNPDQGLSVRTDQMNNVLMCGLTTSDTGIATSGSFQPFFAYAVEGFLVKFDSSGSRLWGTYFGDSSDEISHGITVDAANNIYMTGRSKSISGIASAGAYQATNAGDLDAFIAKFNSSGARLYSTYFGGISTDFPNGISIDALNNVYIVGSTTSTSGIASPGAHKTSWSYYYDVLLAKFCFDVNAGNLSGADTLCVSESTSYLPSISGGTFYSKTGKTSISGSTVYGITAGIDTILYVVENNCSADTVSKEIWINPAPAIDVISSVDTLCLFDSAIISSSRGWGTWLSTTGVTSISGGYVKALTIGSDTILHITTNACGIDTALKYMETINCTTKIIEHQKENLIKINPNPAQNYLIIKGATIGSLAVFYDISGKKVLQDKTTKYDHLINIENLPSGAYSYQIFNPEGKKISSGMWEKL